MPTQGSGKESRDSWEFSRRKVLAAGAAVSVGGLFWLRASAAQAPETDAGPLQIEVQARGVPQVELDRIADRLLELPQERGARARRRNRRVLAVRVVDPEERGKSRSERSPVPTRWRATVYDYATQQALMLEGRLGDLNPDRELVLAGQPLPSPREWAEARDTLLRHDGIGQRLRNGDLIAYPPMPPVLDERRRWVTVGLLPARLAIDGPRHEIVAVDLAESAVRRFAARAPESAVAGSGLVCGAPPAAGQGVTGQGTAGEYAITIRRRGTEYWTFTAVRPSASAGRRGSGVELRDVRYRGRKVLHQAHVPILNVKYDGDACGPYRDWQYSESMLQASGTSVAPGFLLTSSRPATLIQSGTDVGNFLGTAVWIEGEEVTLMAELEAGWYRYTSQWTLHTDGTIKPRFGFAAIQNACVCNVHHHHAYWRLDFDIGTTDGNFVQEGGGQNWRVLPREAMAFRDRDFTRRWRVGNRNLAASYEIRPNPTDGLARASSDWPFPVGDLWFLRYRPGQIDDGVDVSTGPVAARLNRFVNREPIDGADLVVWYASHFTHDQGAVEEPGGHDHVVGPDLVPVNW
jgi:hypothetical protein